jgi:hypothetical protein
MTPAGSHGVLNDAKHRRWCPALPAAALFPDLNLIDMRLRRGRVPRLKVMLTHVAVYTDFAANASPGFRDARKRLGGVCTRQGEYVRPESPE